MKRWLSNVLMIICVAVFLISAYFLMEYFLESRQQKNQFDELAALVQQAQLARPDPTEAPQQIPVPDMTGPENTEPATEPAPPLVEVDGRSVLAEYAELYRRNSDMVGWIRIDGTKINYPVMQTPDREDYYLERDFYKEYSAHGCIYVREQCDVERPSDNVIIYGHRMRDGSMFRSLLEYQEKSFFEENPYIFFDTLTEHHTYQILAVFKTTATSNGFYYHLFVDAADENAFQDYMDQCKALSLYDTGISAQYGDKLITLSTCEWSQTDGRLVVVAKRID